MKGFLYSVAFIAITSITMINAFDTACNDGYNDQDHQVVSMVEEEEEEEPVPHWGEVVKAGQKLAPIFF